MDVFRHEEVGVEDERVRLAGFFDQSFDGVFGFRVFEERETPVTTEGDEVELACILSSFEAYRHGLAFIVWEEKSGSRLCANAHSCDEAA